MAIRTEQEQQAALALALDTLMDLVLAMDARPGTYLNWSEAKRSLYANVEMAVYHCQVAKGLMGEGVVTVIEAEELSGAGAGAGSTAVVDFEAGLETAAPGTYEAPERLGRAGRAWLESQPWGQA